MICECCWKETNDPMEYDNVSMCKECYERTVPTMDDIIKSEVAGKEDLWRGTYLLESGNRLRCHDCYQYEESDWHDKNGNTDVIGSIYFEIDVVCPDRPGGYWNDYGGGEWGYTEKSTFADFCKSLNDWYGEVIAGKISDDDDEPTEV